MHRVPAATLAAGGGFLVAVQAGWDRDTQPGGRRWLPVLTAVLAPPSARCRAPRASMLAQHLAPGTDASRLLPKSRLGDAGSCSAGFESLIPRICMGRIWGKTQL